MRTHGFRFLQIALLGSALACGTVISPVLRGADKVYHDTARNDDHHWDSHEDKAYRIWVKENHRKYADFGKLKEEERQQYWAWRRDHSDAVLKIDIR